MAHCWPKISVGHWPDLGLGHLSQGLSGRAGRWDRSGARLLLRNLLQVHCQFQSDVTLDQTPDARGEECGGRQSKVFMAKGISVRIRQVVPLKSQALKN